MTKVGYASHSKNFWHQKIQKNILYQIPIITFILLYFLNYINPNKDGKKTKSLATVVNKQIREYGDNNESVEDHHPTLKGKAKKYMAGNINLSKLVSTKLSCGDIREAVRLLSFEDKVLEPNETILEKLREKHPCPHPETESTGPPSDMDRNLSIAVLAIDVRKAILSFANGSAGG